MARVKMHLVDDDMTCHEFHVWDWLKDNQLKEFMRRMKAGQRYGQAFMNSLFQEDYTKLTGTTADPFYSDDEQLVSDAIKFLLEH